MAVSRAMLRPAVSYAVVVALALAGYLGGPPWLVLAGAGGIMLDGWGLRGLPPHSRMDWTAKTTTYFVTGVVATLIVAALAFAAGRAARVLLG